MKFRTSIVNCHFEASLKKSHPNEDKRRLIHKLSKWKKNALRYPDSDQIWVTNSLGENIEHITEQCITLTSDQTLNR